MKDHERLVGNGAKPDEGVTVCADHDTSHETALAVMPKNELGVDAKKAGSGADRLGKRETRFTIGLLSGVAMIIGAVVTIQLAPATATVLVGLGLASFFGGVIVESFYQNGRPGKEKHLASLSAIPGVSAEQPAPPTAPNTLGAPSPV